MIRLLHELRREPYGDVVTPEEGVVLGNVGWSLA